MSNADALRRRVLVARAVIEGLDCLNNRLASVETTIPFKNVTAKVKASLAVSHARQVVEWMGTMAAAQWFQVAGAPRPQVSIPQPLDTLDPPGVQVKFNARLLDDVTEIDLGALTELSPTVVDHFCVVRTMTLISGESPGEGWERLCGTANLGESEGYRIYVTLDGILQQAREIGDAPPDTPFLYVGPIDGQTREWCLAHVGKVFRRATIEAMTGPMPVCVLTRGGWECRHRWQAVVSDDLCALADTGDAAPGYQSQIAWALNHRREERLRAARRHEYFGARFV